MYQKMIVLPDKVRMYTVQYMDVSVDKNAESALDAFRNEILSTNQGSRARNEKKITMDGHPGRAFQVEVPGKGDLTIHVCLTKNRLYSLIARGSSRKGAPEDIQAFFDSFRITAP